MVAFLLTENAPIAPAKIEVGSVRDTSELQIAYNSVCLKKVFFRGDYLNLSS